MCNPKSVTIWFHKQRISRGHHSRFTVEFLPGTTDKTKKITWRFVRYSDIILFSDFSCYGQAFNRHP